MGQSSLKQSTARLQAYLESRVEARCAIQAVADMASQSAPQVVSQTAPQVVSQTAPQVVSQTASQVASQVKSLASLAAPAGSQAGQDTDLPLTQINPPTALLPAQHDQVLAMPGPAGLLAVEEELNRLDEQPKEKRGSHRKSTALAGVIQNEGSRQEIACRIVDLSATGARVKLRLLSGTGLSAPSITNEFQLFLTYDRMSVPCSVEWRDGEHVGARFTLAPQFY